jgi:hypothetical protein
MAKNKNDVTTEQQPVVSIARKTRTRRGLEAVLRADMDKLIRTLIKCVVSLPTDRAKDALACIEQYREANEKALDALFPEQPDIE